jgi:hypothetical protein
MNLLLIFLKIMNNLKNEKFKDYRHKISANLDNKNISENSFSQKKTRGSQICCPLPSEERTLNTRSNMVNEKKKCLLYQELYQNHFINLFDNLNKAFESLEQIIINDNNNNVENEESSGINSFSCKICNIDIKEKEFINKSIINNTKGRDKSKSISIPKLNFNRIFEYYQNENVKIIETQIEKMHKNLMKHHHKHHHHNHLQMKDDNYDNEIVNKN